MKKNKTLWLLIAGLILLLILLVVFGKKDEGLKVVTEKAGLNTIIESVSASGKIYPEIEVKISPEVSGEIIELNVAEGDPVQRGELLVKINPAIYNSVVSQASASVSQSEANVSNTKSQMDQTYAQFSLALANYNRNKKLFEDKEISAVEFEQVEAQYKSAKATYEATKANDKGVTFAVHGAQASLNQAKENLRKTTVFAPREGIVSQLNVKKGERVLGTAQMQGTEMLTIADMNRMEVRVDVSETDITKVALGDSALVETDAYRDRKFKGIVSKIAVSSGKSGASSLSASTDQVANYTVHILILPESYRDLSLTNTKNNFIFKPGMSASVEIQTKKEINILTVPVNAVTTRDWTDSLLKIKKTHPELFKQEFRQVVFLYNSKDKTVKLVEVNTGIQDNLNIHITAGLKEGDEVVVAPYNAISKLLTDKMKVEVVKKENLFEEKKE